MLNNINLANTKVNDHDEIVTEKKLENIKLIYQSASHTYLRHENHSFGYNLACPSPHSKLQ